MTYLAVASQAKTSVESKSDRAACLDSHEG
jgi:hypothetical protein